MNNGPLLFLGILVTLAASFWSLLVAPQLQIGQQQPAILEATGETYPTRRPGMAQQGAEVYRSLGCVECHSQQVRQTGVLFDVWLAEPGTNQTELAATLARLAVPTAEATRAISQAPARLLVDLDLNHAQAVAAQITNGGARAQAVLVNLGPDIQRGWGRRVTVTQDYLADYPVQLGNSRIGPDLANYGARSPGLPAILDHLYAPQKTAPGSMMPPYRFLFTKRKLREGEAAQGAPSAGSGQGVEPGYEIIPKPEAEALAAYLMSLRAEVQLKEAPVPNPPTATPPCTNQPTAIPAPVTPTAVK